MTERFVWLVSLVLAAKALGCSTPPSSRGPAGELLPPTSWKDARPTDGLLGRASIDAAAAEELRLRLSEQLSADSLFTLAAFQHPKLRAAWARILAAQATTYQAGRFPNPALELEVRDIPLSSRQGSHDLDVFAGVRQPLPLSGRLSAAVKLADLERQTAEAQTRCVARDLELAVRTAYATYVAAARQAELLAKLVGLRKQQAAAIEAQVIRELRPRIELTLATDAVARAEMRQVEQQQAVDAAAARLRAAVGDADLRLGALPAEWTPPAAVPDLTLSQWWRHAQLHPKAQVANLGISHGEARTGLDAVQHIHDVEFRLGYHYQGPAESHFLTARVVVPLPMYDRSEWAGPLGQARMAGAEADRDAVMIDLLTSAQAAYKAYVAAAARLNLLEGQLLPNALRRRAIAEEQLKTTANEHDVAEARIAELQVEIERWAIRADLDTAAARWRWFAGSDSSDPATKSQR